MLCLYCLGIYLQIKNFIKNIPGVRRLLTGSAPKEAPPLFMYHALMICDVHRRYDGHDDEPSESISQGYYITQIVLYLD